MPAHDTPHANMAHVYDSRCVCFLPDMETATAISPVRRSRLRRNPTGKRIELQPRDLEIFSLLTRYRYLRSTYIHAFVGGDKTKLIERLGKLYHEVGFLNRPSEQWETLNARHQPAVYEIAERGRFVLQSEGVGSAENPVRADRHGDRHQFRHGLMVCDCLASIELAARLRPGLRFIDSAEILAKAPAAVRNHQTDINFPVSVAHGFSGGRIERASFDLIPDGLFGLEYEGPAGKSYRFFAIEADRGTMPAARENLRQSSYLRKILGYREVLEQRLYKDRLSIPNLVVLTVSAAERHLRNLATLAREISGDGWSRALLFKPLPPNCTVPCLELLLAPWQRPTGEAFDISVP